MIDLLQLALLVFAFKIATLATGLAMVYMGYRLFLADKLRPAGDLETKIGNYALSLRGGAPGVFFALFGTSLVLLTVWKGMSYELPQETPGPGTVKRSSLPERPPSEDLPEGR